MLENRTKGISRSDARFFTRRFFRHEPLFGQASILAEEPAVTSLIDLSDAVKDTVEIVCASSQVGAAVNVDSIVVDSATIPAAVSGVDLPSPRDLSNAYLAISELYTTDLW